MLHRLFVWSFLLSSALAQNPQAPTAPSEPPSPPANPGQPGTYNQPVVVGSSFESVEMKRLELQQERETLAAQKTEFASDVAMLKAKLAAAAISASAPESIPPDLGIYNSFLSARPGDVQRSDQYHALLKQTLNALVASNPYSTGNTNWSDPKLAEANLAKLREFPEDDDVSRTIQDQIAAIRGGEFTGAQRGREIDAELKNLAEDLRRNEWNLKQSMGTNPLTGRPNASEADVAMYQESIAEIKANQVALRTEKLALSKGVSGIPRKIGFQQLIVELALQQRYIHSLIACGFYRFYSAEMQFDPAAYAAHEKDGDEGKENDANSAPTSSSSGTGNGKGSQPSSGFDPVPTIPSMEALLIGRIRDAIEDRRSIDSKLQAKQFVGAESLLRKMLATAKYQPELHTIPLEDRQKLFRFGQDMKRLSDALASYDYDGITKISQEVESSCADLSLLDVKAFAAKHPTKAVHFAQQARLAQKAGNLESMNAFMTAAMERAPLDLEVKKILREIQDSVVNDQELVDELKRIVEATPPRYREAFDRKDEFGRLDKGANSDLKAKFEALLEMEADVRAVLEKSDTLERRSNYPEIWIALSEIDSALAEDSRIVARKSKIVGRCPEFVNAYEQATEQEKSGGTSLALAWYLTALIDAPGSPEIIEKIDSLSKQLANE
jgi:hypothetical protein